MPGRIYEAIESFQAQILRSKRRAASELVRAYGNAWARIKIELELLMSEYEKAKAMGRGQVQVGYSDSIGRGRYVIRYFESCWLSRDKPKQRCARGKSRLFEPQKSRRND